MKSSALEGGSIFGDLICEFLLSFGIRRRTGLEGGRRRKLGQEETGERGNGETEVVELGFRQFLCSFLPCRITMALVRLSSLIMLDPLLR